MTAWYNEIDPYAAQWLRNLIEAGEIAPGIVDERSIEDVYPSDLRGFTQCHFFAGVGIWSLALRKAGWADDRPVWTGSCPCQPFSTAGQGAGFADERHLWPAFFHLITQRKPPVIYGEQVAGKDGGIWIDLVQADMEGLGYPFGAVPFPSCSVGGPHKRERTYWMGNTQRKGLERLSGNDSTKRGERPGRSTSKTSNIGLLEHANLSKYHERTSIGEQSIRQQCDTEPSSLVTTESEQERVSRFARESGATRGYWSAADWIPCADGYWRPVQPGTFPLAHGVANRMGKIRAYGNAINAIQAQIFIESTM